MNQENVRAFFQKKRNLVFLILLVLCFIAVGIYALITLSHSNQETASPSTQQEMDLISAVTGMRGWVVEQGTQAVDFLEGIVWDEHLVQDVTVDSSGVNLAIVGDYELIYIIHRAQDSQQPSTASYKVTVKVVAKEDAEKAVEDGVEVVTKENGVQNKQDSPLPTEPESSSPENSQQNSSRPQGNEPSQGSGTTQPDAPSGSQEGTPHTHTWVYVSPENSGYMDYAAECRSHGYNGEEPMFFRSMNDLFLHQAADGCMSGWGTGFKGLAYQRCSGCGEIVITGHVHDFGTVIDEIPAEEVVCECGMSFAGGKDYTALENWKTHVEIYTSHGYPLEEHDTYKQNTCIYKRYRATKSCTCGWRPVDNRPVY